MFKKLNHHSPAFQLVHLLILGAVFFAQMQVSFIERAYGSDGINMLYSSGQHHPITKAQIGDKKVDDKDYSKLNKRFPLSHTFTIYSPQQIASPSFALAHLQCIYSSPSLIADFNTAFSFRGPPAAFLA